MDDGCDDRLTASTLSNTSFAISQIVFYISALNEIRNHTNLAGGRNYVPGDQQVIHVEAVLDMLLAKLMEYLFRDNRIEDARLASTDEEMRKRFYREYELV